MCVTDSHVHLGLPIVAEHNLKNSPLGDQSVMGWLACSSLFDEILVSLGRGSVPPEGRYRFNLCSVG